MVLKPLQASNHCPFARLASSDCFFISNEGCTLFPSKMKEPLFISYHELREDMLAKQSGELDERSGVRIRGPFNRLLTMRRESLDHLEGREPVIAQAIVGSNSIDVSTPLYPRDLAAFLGVCIAVIGTRVEQGVGIFNILVHLLPTGHLGASLFPSEDNNTCCARQFHRWIARLGNITHGERKALYLKNMLNIFRGGGWDMTIATPVIGEGDAERWISHIDASHHLVDVLGYNRETIEVKCTSNVRVASNGKIYLESSARQHRHPIT